MTQTCRDCGVSNRESALFCHACGERLSTESSDKPVPVAPDERAWAATTFMSHEAHDLQIEPTLVSASTGAPGNAANEQAQPWVDPPVLTDQVSAADGYPAGASLKSESLFRDQAAWLARVKAASGRASRWSVLLLLGTAAVIAATALKVASVSPWNKPMAPPVQQVASAEQTHPDGLTESTGSLPIAASQAPEPAPAPEPPMQGPSSIAPITATAPGLSTGQRPDTKANQGAVSENPPSSDQPKPADISASAAPAVSPPAPVASKFAASREAAHPQDVCASTSSFQRNACLSEQCAQPPMNQHAVCVGLRRQREQELFQEIYGRP